MKAKQSQSFTLVWWRGGQANDLDKYYLFIGTHIIHWDGWLEKNEEWAWANFNRPTLSIYPSINVHCSKSNRIRPELIMMLNRHRPMMMTRWQASPILDQFNWSVRIHNSVYLIGWMASCILHHHHHYNHDQSCRRERYYIVRVFDSIVQSVYLWTCMWSGSDKRPMKWWLSEIVKQSNSSSLVRLTPFIILSVLFVYMFLSFNHNLTFSLALTGCTVYRILWLNRDQRLHIRIGTACTTRRGWATFRCLLSWRRFTWRIPMYKNKNICIIRSNWNVTNHEQWLVNNNNSNNNNIIIIIIIIIDHPIGTDLTVSESEPHWDDGGVGGRQGLFNNAANVEFCTAATVADDGDDDEDDEEEEVDDAGDDEDDDDDDDDETCFGPVLLLLVDLLLLMFVLLLLLLLLTRVILDELNSNELLAAADDEPLLAENCSSRSMSWMKPNNTIRYEWVKEKT